MVDEESLNYLFQALAHETRRKITKLLGTRVAMTFTELMRETGIEETGPLGFHMGRMEELVHREKSGEYKLSDLGALVYRVIRYAEGGGDAAEAVGRVKTFKGVQRLLVNKEMLDKYSGVGFRHIETLIFEPDVDGQLFRDKVLYLEYIGESWFLDI